MADPIQHQFNKIFDKIKEEHPDFTYFQLEARLNAYLSSQLSKFRHRKNNPEQYTGMVYDPEGKLKDNNVIDINDYNHLDTRFFSSKIPQC